MCLVSRKVLRSSQALYHTTQLLFMVAGYCAPCPLVCNQANIVDLWKPMEPITYNTNQCDTFVTTTVFLVSGWAPILPPHPPIVSLGDLFSLWWGFGDVFESSFGGGAWWCPISKQMCIHIYIYMYIYIYMCALWCLYAHPYMYNSIVRMYVLRSLCCWTGGSEGVNAKMNMQHLHDYINNYGNHLHTYMKPTTTYMKPTATYLCNCSIVHRVSVITILRRHLSFQVVFRCGEAFVM